MLDDRIKQIKSAIEMDSSLSKTEREKLLHLSDELYAELAKLEKTDKQKSDKIAEDAHKAVGEASSKHALSLRETVEEFEVSHPNLTRIIQTLCAQFGV